MPNPSQHSVRNLLFVVTSHDRKGDKPGGFHLSELSHPFRVLHDAGYRIDIASPRGSARVDPDSLDLKDNTNAWFWNDMERRRTAEQPLRLDAVDAGDYAGIYFVGGHAAMWDLPDNPALVALVARVYENGGVVGAVCHGPAALVNVRLGDGSYLVQGRNVACFTNDEERAAHMEQVIPFFLADRLEERGATHLPAPDFAEQVVVDERLVTGQNPASATGVGEAMLALLRNAGLTPQPGATGRDRRTVENIPARNG
jgi:putative intracellular protease/amidase